ncbi:MAG: hypothetical protein AB7L91_16610 [Dehalococcoidia bacterium]
MVAYFGWLERRIRRSVWLLCQGETSGDTLKYVAQHAFHFARNGARTGLEAAGGARSRRGG